MNEKPVFSEATTAVMDDIAKRQEAEAIALWLQEQRSQQARLIEKFFICTPEGNKQIREAIKLYYKREGAPGAVKVIAELQEQKYCIKKLWGEDLARALRELLGEQEGLTRQNLNKLLQTSPAPSSTEKKDILSRIP